MYGEGGKWVWVCTCHCVDTTKVLCESWIPYHRLDLTEYLSGEQPLRSESIIILSPVSLATPVDTAASAGLHTLSLIPG